MSDTLRIPPGKSGIRGVLQQTGGPAGWEKAAESQ